MPTPDVAQEIDSQCRKCGEATLHIIVSLVDDEVSKVQCKRCQAVHKYREPKAEKARKAAEKKAAKKKVAKVKKPRKTRRHDEIKPKMSADLSRPIRSYNFRESYEPGERIEHAKFGVGIVETLTNFKMEVFFEGVGEVPEATRKVLAQGRD